MKKLLVAGCALLVVCAAFTAVRAGAQPAIMVASPQYVTFGMVGLGTGQTARLNAFSLPVGGPIIAGGSCQVTFAFYNEAGKSVKTGTATVAQGASVHFDMQRTDIDTTSGLSEIRGTVRAAFVSSSAVGTTVTPGTPVSGVCSVLPTMEIFDSLSGQTTVVLQQTTALSLVTPL
ncbi:MAG: hypothetical protein WBL65_02425 [Bryobacteraceae bacterium]